MNPELTWFVISYSYGEAALIEQVIFLVASLTTVHSDNDIP